MSQVSCSKIELLKKEYYSSCGGYFQQDLFRSSSEGKIEIIENSNGNGKEE